MSERPSKPDNSSHADAPLSMSVFFPCHNEEGSVESVVRKAYEFLGTVTGDFEIIVVDDGSRDRTGEIADRLAGELPCVRVVHHAANGGYGAALQSGLRAATKDLIFYTDGDGQFDIREAGAMLGFIRQYDIVAGYRLNRREGLVRRLNGWCWTRLVCLVFGMRVRDIDCAFKLLRRQVVQGMALRSTGALISAELLARAKRKGCTIKQCGVHHYPRTAGRATGAKPAVIIRAFRELLQLRRDIMSEPRA